MTRPSTLIATVVALATAGCSSLSFPSLPSFSLLEGNDTARSQTTGGVSPLPSRPDHFRYNDASVRTSIRFARRSSHFEENTLATLAPIQEALALDPQAHLLIAGFASRGAAPGADRVLGEQRALALRSSIITRSPSFHTRIHTTSFGSDRPPAGHTSPRDQVDLVLFSSSTSAPESTPPSPAR